MPVRRSNRRYASLVAAALISFVAVACGEDATKAGDETGSAAGADAADSSANVDTSATDTTTAADSGSVADSGGATKDAGPVDAGSASVDAGANTDTGMAKATDVGAEADDAGAEDAATEDTATEDTATEDTATEDTAIEDIGTAADANATAANDAGGNDAGSTSAMDAGPTVTDAGGTTTADAGPSSSDAGTNAATDTGPANADVPSTPDINVSPDAGGNKAPQNGPKNGKHLHIWLSASVVEKKSSAGELQISCKYVDKDLKPLADPGDLEVKVNAADAKYSKGMWTFTKAGKVDVTCTSKSLNMGHQVDVLVASRGLDPAVSRMASELERGGTLVTTIIETGKKNDKAAQQKALKEFDKSGKEMWAGFAEKTRALIPHPNGMPKLAKLQAKGLKAGPDDVKWLAAVTETKAAVAAMKKAIAAVDPKKPSAADLAAIGAAQKLVDAGAAKLAKLKPSPLAVYTNLAAVDDLIGKDLAGVTRAHQLMLSKAFHHLDKTAPPPPCNGCFSLVGVMVSIGVQYVLSSIPSYTGILKDIGWQIGEMVLTLVIKDVIDDQFPPQAGGPSITAMARGSAVSVSPGYALTIMGANFGDKPGQCGVVFITPMVSKTIIDAVKLIVGGIPKLSDLKSKGAWEAAKAIKSGIDQLKAFVALTTDAIPQLAESGVVLMWSQSKSTFANPAFIKLGVVPKKSNCGWLPKPGIMLPLCSHTGRGPSFTVTVIGKKC